MPNKFVNRSLGAAVRRVPGLRRLPAAKLLAAAEVAMLAREHVARLSPAERRRVVELVRIGRGRPQNLSEQERDELSRLIAKMEPRVLAGQAVEKLSPVPLPHRLIYGATGRRVRTDAH
jgi:hypothetical protein